MLLKNFRVPMPFFCTNVSVQNSKQSIILLALYKYKLYANFIHSLIRPKKKQEVQITHNRIHNKLVSHIRLMFCFRFSLMNP